MTKYLGLFVLLFFSAQSFAKCIYLEDGEPIYLGNCGGNDVDSRLAVGLSAAAYWGVGLVLEPNTSYTITSPILVSDLAIPKTTPTFIDGNGSTLIADSTFPSGESMLNLVGIGSITSDFFIHDLKISGDEIADSGVKVLGGHDFEIRGVEVRETLLVGFSVHSDTSIDPAIGRVRNIALRNAYARAIGIDTEVPGDSSTLHFPCSIGTGFDFDGINSSYAMTGVSCYSCDSTFNLGDGFDIKHATVNFHGSRAEKNEGWGFRFKNTKGVGLIGNYVENNHNGDPITEICTGDSTGQAARFPEREAALCGVSFGCLNNLNGTHDDCEDSNSDDDEDCGIVLLENVTQTTILGGRRRKSVLHQTEPDPSNIEIPVTQDQ